MRNGYLRYFIGFIITLGLIIALIILLFGGGSNTASKPAPRLLSSYADTGSVASMTIDGPVSAQSTHYQIRVSVNRDSATFQQFVGYDGTVVNAKSYSNSVNAYTVFLKALAHAGFTLGDTKPAIADPTGYCPLGSVYTFELQDKGSSVEKFWTNSCGSPKTYRGNTNLTISLFRSQIPDYSSLMNNVTF